MRARPTSLVLPNSLVPLYADVEYLLAMAVVVFAALAVTAVGYWKTFEKAGEPGWAAFVPLYNLWVLCRIAHCARFWFWLSFVPVVNAFALVRIAVGVADQFGRGVPFGMALLVVPWVAWPVLGFARFEYRPGIDVSEWSSRPEEV